MCLSPLEGQEGCVFGGSCPSDFVGAPNTTSPARRLTRSKAGLTRSKAGDARRGPDPGIAPSLIAHLGEKGPGRCAYFWQIGLAHSLDSCCPYYILLVFRLVLSPSPSFSRSLVHIKELMSLSCLPLIFIRRRLSQRFQSQTLIMPASSIQSDVPFKHAARCIVQFLLRHSKTILVSSPSLQKIRVTRNQGQYKEQNKG